VPLGAAMEHLDRDVAPERLVARGEHDTHPAAAQLTKHAVPADCFGNAHRLKCKVRSDGEWRYRLTVRTDGSQPSNRGSIPRTATNLARRLLRSRLRLGASESDGIARRSGVRLEGLSRAAAACARAFLQARARGSPNHSENRFT